MNNTNKSIIYEIKSCRKKKADQKTDYEVDMEKEINNNNDLLSLSLVAEKQKIDKYCAVWDKYKKFTNEYEFIYSSPDNLYKSVLINNKISRAYYKLWEILHNFDVFEFVNTNNNINIANICEAPGSFIEALIDYCKKNNINTKKIFFFGLSVLNEKKYSIPTWKIKNKHLQNYNIQLNNKNDNIGDIYNYQDVLKYINLVSLNSCNIITCDGGFDINGDYENQEKLLNKLLLCETFLVLKLQKNLGKCIIKCFDLLSIDSIKIIYILSLFYNDISFIKPHTSRPANSEKYILCKNFNEDNLIKHENILSLLYEFLYGSSSSLIIDIPLDFKLLITKYNIYCTNQQIFNINNTIELIEKMSLINNIEDRNIILQKKYKENFEKCKDWCNKYGFLY